MLPILSIRRMLVRLGSPPPPGLVSPLIRRWQRCPFSVLGNRLGKSLGMPIFLFKKPFRFVEFKQTTPFIDMENTA
ncbi:hypothetical protein [Burkholderia humptydooensis]|uniref:hypothetical protein n=1 Tax=Burkholderia humptydooensis TaxID=430531 RepID=UPI0010FE1DC1|nr:hypothetical protein [Burkholderia humptydooensis]